MSSATPPNPYFSGINFNSSFFSNIGDYLTEAIANSKYLRLIGGTLSGFLGINRTPRVELDVNGKAVINDATNGGPANSILGSVGTKLILTEGTVSETPNAIGTDVSSMWFGVSSTKEHRFYTGTNQRMVITSSGSVGIGTTVGTSANTKLTIIGSSTGYSQPLVQITQSNPTWDGNYALQVDGYTLLGGFRINANDGGNSIYQTLANKDIGIAQFPNATNTGNIATTTFGTGVIKFFTNGNNERVRIDEAGSFYVNTYGYFGALDNSGLRIDKTGLFLSSANTAPLNIYHQNTSQSVKLGFFGGNGLIVTINNTSVDITQQLNLTSGNLQLGSTNGNNVAVATAPNQYSTSAANGDMVIRSIQKLLLQSGSGNSAITIGTNNYLGLGIGSTTANFPITLYSTSSTAQSMTSYAIAGISIYNGNQSTPINPAITVGIMSQAAFNSGFYVYSDQRIKKDITPLENSLDIIDKINTVSFKYIDFIEKGTIKNYGVIAQEIEKIIPEVINSHKDYIPNIYKNADKYDNELLRLYIKTDDLSIGDDIKIYDMKNKHHLKKIVDKTDEYITINEPIEDYEEDTSVFVYGKEIEDVKNVNYESLFIMNIKATQELHQRLKTLEDIIKNLINR